VLLEEVRERAVIEQVFGLDRLDLARNRIRRMRDRGAVTPPSGKANTLDLPIDPKLVHERAEAFRAGVSDERAQILRGIPDAWFHSIEDESGVFAQRMHVAALSLTLT
jgi:hypothetical protein